MKKNARILVVGLGSIGQRHARLLAERTDIELDICDMVEENRAGTMTMLSGTTAMPSGTTTTPSGTKTMPSGTTTAPLNRQVNAYSVFSEALKARPDLVFVCVPNQFHVSIGLQAMESGADIFVEKPVSDTIESARMLVAAAEARDRFMQVGYMLRLDEGLGKMKEIVDRGDLGQLIGGRAMIGTYITLLNAKSNDRETSPNSLIVDYTHELDFIRWFFGDVREIKAMSARLGDLERKPHPNIFQMLFKMESGALVQVHMDYIQFPQRRIFEIYGDHGTLSYDFMTGEIRKFNFQKEHQWEDHSVLPITDRWDDLFRKEHQMIFERRTGGLPPLVSGRDGLQALELAERTVAALHAL